MKRREFIMLLGGAVAVRKATLERVLARAASGLRFNDHEDGSLVFLNACKLGLESIVSRRRDSIYASGRSTDWVKSKNPNAPAVRREMEEDWTWGRGKRSKSIIPQSRIQSSRLRSNRPLANRGVRLGARS